MATAYDQFARAAAKMAQGVRDQGPPDVIFDRGSNGERKLATFTYERRLNVLSTGRDVAFLVHRSVESSLAFLLDPGEPTFTWWRE